MTSLLAAPSDAFVSRIHTGKPWTVERANRALSGKTPGETIDMTQPVIDRYEGREHEAGLGFGHILLLNGLARFVLSEESKK